jgi:hypothetical protein
VKCQDVHALHGFVHAAGTVVGCLDEIEGIHPTDLIPLW